MDPFKQMRQIEQMLASLQPALEQYDKLQRDLQKLADGPLIKDWVKEFERSQHSFRLAADFANRQEAMLAAIKPVDFGAIQVFGKIDTAAFDTCGLPDAGGSHQAVARSHGAVRRAAGHPGPRQDAGGSLPGPDGRSRQARGLRARWS